MKIVFLIGLLGDISEEGNLSRKGRYLPDNERQIPIVISTAGVVFESKIIDSCSKGESDHIAHAA